MKAKVLLVDDEPAVLACLTAVLGRQGYSVTAAATGEAALDQLERRVFDLVVTDYRMPGLGGDAVVRAIRERQDDVAVLLITGLVDELPDWLRSGPEAVRILAKPFAISDLLREAAGVLRSAPTVCS
ncbi:MAG: response regulator [Opitutaceae bacterium]|nr:response regulator [Opitutaceae bacterium]